MKRGLIAWDKNEIPPAVFDRRMARLRDAMVNADLPAIVVYSELWRSNQARFFVNYMPYFNRALLIVPRSEPPILLCGLSPRVYSWIRSVTTIEDIRPAGNFARPLFQLASERHWKRIGVLDVDQLPYDLHQALRVGESEIANVPSDSVFSPGTDENELAMRRMALSIARPVLEDEISKHSGGSDYEFIGRLEGRLRRAGVEDVIVHLKNNSVSLAVEYRGHWVRLSRPKGSTKDLAAAKQQFIQSLGKASGEIARPQSEQVIVEALGGSYPFEAANEIGANSIFAMHVQIELNGTRVLYGDTCYYSESGPEIL